MNSFETESTPRRMKTGKQTRRLTIADRFPCHRTEQNISQYPVLMDFLPAGYGYHICNYKAIRQMEDHTGFQATIRLSISTAEAVQEWLKGSQVTWRVARTRPKKGQRVLFKVEYRCHHNTRNPKTAGEGHGRRTKNTNCPAKMCITVMQITQKDGRDSQSRDPHMPTFPTLINLINDHNHNLNGVNLVSHIDVEEEEIAFEEIGVALEEQGEASGVSEKWDVMCQEFSTMVRNQEELHGAASAFMKTFDELKGNPSKLVLAMHMFGHFSVTGLAPKRAQALRRAHKRVGSSIAGQSTSRSRQKNKLMKNEVADNWQIQKDTSNPGPLV